MHKNTFEESERVKRTPSITKKLAIEYHITHSDGLHKAIAKIYKIFNN